MGPTQKDRLSAFITLLGHEESRQDEMVSEDYLQFIEQYDDNNKAIGMCEYIDRHLRDDESYRIACHIILSGGGNNMATTEEVSALLGGRDRHVVARWEMMVASGFATQPDNDEEWEVNILNLARYIRFMDFDNPFATGENQ